MIAVIMAGGVGSRFWPRSRRNRPKQLLDIVSDQSMIRVTFDRLSGITDPNNIYVVAGPTLKSAIETELPEMPASNLIIEPSGKNTAPCIGLVAALLAAENPDGVMGVFPADHLIGDEQSFCATVKAGIDFARTHDVLMTFGIEPTKAVTGYGYIKFDHRQSFYHNKIFKVVNFLEKPNQAEAERLFASNEYLWNSGMFLWRISSILKAFRTHLPEMHSALTEIARVAGRKSYQRVLDEKWQELVPESIDYAIMEHANNVYVIKGQFKWNDVGSWDALYDLSTKDTTGNHLVGNIQAINTENCFIHSKDLRIATLGVKNLIVIKSGNALLVVNRGNSEGVKQIVNDLKDNTQIEYL